jgi:hypothetical protein
MSEIRDCRTCKHNTYIGNPSIREWVDCNHPITRARQGKPQPGDPAMVDYRTADMHVSEIHNLRDCPTYEAHT